LRYAAVVRWEDRVAGQLTNDTNVEEARADAERLAEEPE
jgi:hypothetical protein